MTEKEAFNKRIETVNESDANRLKLSKLNFDKMDRKASKFREIYQETGGKCCKSVNPLAYQSVLETMHLRKLKQECQQRNK